MKKIILTFDYELFFGDHSGTVRRTLIEPTDLLLNAMESVGFKGNFFVDWLMLKYLKEEGSERTDSDYSLIVKQLKNILQRGHRIELHIHPHWLDAKYNGDGTWNFSEFRRYSLNSFSEDEISAMFMEGVECLTSIARMVVPNYKIVAFRAGGWAVQPFNKIKKGFKSTGILIDSSVMPGVEIITDYSYCNFLNIQISNRGFYSFSNDISDFVLDKKGPFIEVPISSVKPNFISRVFGLLSRKSGVRYKPIADGTHTRTGDNPDIWNVPSHKVICTFSTVPPLVAFFRLLLSKGEYFCYIDHPKDVSNLTALSIKSLSLICKSMLLIDFIDRK